MDIACRGSGASMTQQDLDGPEVGTRLQQVGSKAVAEDVGRHELT